ncbi:hypothetical protein G6F57_018539 [Rhizopus arrhizus]|nr:hypothetical protein G6F57_018539 [Rhizopus arrhizus]
MGQQRGEAAALAMAEDDAGASQFQQLPVRVQRHVAMRQPTRHELLGESVEGVDGELLRRIGVARLPGGRVARSRADAEQAPGFFLGPEDRRAVVDLRIHRPGRAAAFRRIGYEHVVARLQQAPQPTFAAVGRALPLRARHAAAVPKQHGVGMQRLGQPVFLHVKLADAVAAVHVDQAGRRVVHHFFLQHRHAAGPGFDAAQEMAADGFEQDRGMYLGCAK